MATKVCSGCEETKPESAFYAKCNKCKACTLARQKELKAAKAGGTAAPVKRAKKAGRPAAPPPQASSAALTMPAGLGLSASINDETNDIVLEQSTAAGTATIWMSRHEAQQLAIFIAGLADQA